MPHIKNFTPTKYLNSGKIWDIKSSPNGMVYLASDKGLLEYDGNEWQLFNGSAGVTRSIFVENDSIIFTGSDLDFGVWSKNKDNSFSYKSLYPFKDDIQDFVEEFWHIYKTQGVIIFESQHNLYIYANQHLTKYKLPNLITGSYQINDNVYFKDATNKLFIYNKSGLENVNEGQIEFKYSLVGIYNHNNQNFFVTKSSGIFSFQNGDYKEVLLPVSSALKNAKVFSFESIGNSYLAFGTVLKGLIITDLDGNIIHSINKYKGLLSNTILCLNYSKNGKLWIGMDYGISTLLLDNNFTYFFDNKGDFGTGYDAELFNSKFYLGTNQGLYYSTWQDLDDKNEFLNFKLISGTEGQVWYLLNYDNQLFIGHDHGLLTYKNGELKSIFKNQGVWTMLPYKSYLLAGTYNGICLFTKTETGWKFYKKMETLSGSCNQLLYDDTTKFWVRIPNFGIINIVLDSDLKLVNQTIYSDSIFSGEVKILLKDSVGIKIVTSEKIYKFNTEKKKFESFSIQPIFTLPEEVLPDIIAGKIINNEYHFYPIYNGFAFHYNNDYKSIHSSIPSPIIRRVLAYNNNGPKQIFEADAIQHKYNNVRVEFVLPNYDQPFYQYKLDDNEKWSNFSSENNFEFIDLSSGKHQLFIRAKYDTIISPETKFSFTILKPWYMSWSAIGLYTLLLFFVVLIIVINEKRMLKKQEKYLLKKEKETLEIINKEHAQQLMKMEQERVEMENSQLKQQLRMKTIDLANKAKDVDEKNRLLMAMKEKFEEIHDTPKSANEKLRDIRRLLDSYISVEDHTFEILMDELHQEFFKKLKDQFPSLSNNDLRLCAYLKVGMSSKEIADILNIQPSSSYISRSRLRKKLNLNSDENLYEFLNGIG